MKKKRTRTEKISRTAYLLVLLSFVLPIGYLIYRIIFWNEAVAETLDRTRADYVLMLLQCLLGATVIHLPTFLQRRFRFELPVTLYLMYILFLYGSIYLGEVRSFFYLVPHWDVYLHTFSSIMIGAFGFIVVALLNRNERTVVNLSPFFVALFSFCLAVTIGALWEIYEFAMDGLVGVNMQKFITADGEILVGHAALTDTMKDVIVDCLGALVSSTAGFFSLKYGKGWASDIISQYSEKHKE